MKPVAKCMVFASVGAALAAAMPVSAAADASAWAQEMHSAVRLIAGSGRDSSGRLRAGVEIRMKPGWKTYWRYPGDAGIPPRLDFTGSSNLASASVSWPAPTIFTDETGKSVGYKDSAILPLSVTPRQQGEPVVLRLTIDYGVCEKLCVPAQGKVSITLDGKSSASDALLAAAEDKVPRRVAADTAGLTAKRIAGQQKPRVLVELPTPPDGRPLQVVAEGPTAEWALPLPTPETGAPDGRRRFSFELDGLPPGVDPNRAVPLTYTILGGDKPIEVTALLD